VKCLAQGDSIYQPPRLQVSASEYNNIPSVFNFNTIHGAKFGVDYILSGKVKVKRNGKQINKSWKTGAYFTFYRYPGNHTGYMLTAESGRQRTGNSGFVSEINFIVGYMLSHREFSEYDLLPRPANTSHLVYGANIGIGWNFQKKFNLPFSLMILPHLYKQTPYKADDILRIGTELKISYLF
jgi:hypothetical protein